MLRLSSHIEIATADEILPIDFVNEIEWESTWENLTDQGRMIIPRKLKWKNKPIVAGNNALFKRGQKIDFWLGYDGKKKHVFSGYISDVVPKLPIEIYFQDEMWILKQRIIKNKSWRQVSLSELMAYCMQGINLPYKLIGDVSLTESQGAIANHPKSKLYKNPSMPQFSINNATVAQVLDCLRKDYGLYSFIRDGVLYVGLPYVPALRKDQVFKFGTNIIQDTLVYRRLEDIRLKVHAISISSVNKRISVDVGDPDGDLRTLHYYGLNLDELTRIANTQLDLLKYEGFVGDFESFGEPFVRHGDGVVFVDPKLPERNGTYLVKKVNYRFGIGGYRQAIELGPGLL